MTDKMVEAYLKALESEERAAATIEKYRRALLSFAANCSSSPRGKKPPPAQSFAPKAAKQSQDIKFGRR